MNVELAKKSESSVEFRLSRELIKSLDLKKENRHKKIIKPRPIDEKSINEYRRILTDFLKSTEEK